MNTILKTGAVSALALMLASGTSFAEGELLGTKALNDRIDDIETDVQDDFDRSQDASRFGNPEFKMGLSGGASLSYAGRTGNNDTQDLAVGVRLRYAQGQWVHSLGAAVDFQEADNVKSTEDIFAVYDANYYFNDKFYGFVLGRVEKDGLATTAGDIETDAFLGFGPGYRVVNTPDMTWRVQAGIGQSYLKDGLGDSTTEVGYIASSRFFYQFNENVFASNDTDILKSDSALRINNDLGVNFRVTDVISTRVSYLTEYNDSRAIRSDNKLGVSLVFGF